MQVQISHREKFRLLGPNQAEVVVSIRFSKVEEEIIAKYDLKHFILFDRMPTIFKDFNDQWRQIDNNIYLGQFIRGAHAEPVSSPAHAKAFENEMRVALEYVKCTLRRDSISSQRRVLEQEHPPVPQQHIS
jgi:hypothetical protein